MPIFEAIVRILIIIGLIVLAFILIVWALGQFGIVLPGQVLNILKVIIALVAILWIARIVVPVWSTPWFTRNPPNP